MLNYIKKQHSLEKTIFANSLLKIYVITISNNYYQKTTEAKTNNQIYKTHTLEQQNYCRELYSTNVCDNHKKTRRTNNQKQQIRKLPTITKLYLNSNYNKKAHVFANSLLNIYVITILNS